MKKCLFVLMVFITSFTNKTLAQRNFQTIISVSAVNTFTALPWTYVSGTPTFPATPIAGDSYEIIFAPSLTGTTIINGVINLYSAGFPTGGNITFTNNSTSTILVYVNGSTSASNNVNNMTITNSTLASGRLSLFIGSNTTVNGKMAINNDATFITPNKDLLVIGSSTKTNTGATPAAAPSNANIQIIGNMEIKASGGNNASFGNSNGSTTTPVSTVSTTIFGNVILGGATAGEGVCSIGKSTISPASNQKFNLYGDLILNPKSGIAEQYTVFNFLKTTGIQTITNNSSDASATVTSLNFETINVGAVGGAGTKLIFQGANKSAYLTYLGTLARIEGTGAAATPINTGININTNSTLDLPRDYASLQDYSLNTKLNPANATVGLHTLRILANAKLRIGGIKTENSDLITGLPGVLGSNFPKVNSTYSLAPTSTVDYYGNATIALATPAIQTIYNVPTYGNLVTNSYLDNSLQLIPNPTYNTGIGRSQKITTAPINVTTQFDIDIRTDVTLGTANNLNNAGVSCAGPITLAAPSITEPTPYLSANGGAGLYCNANVVSGAGPLNMGDYSYLGLGAAGGINANITMPSTFNIRGNYKYTGTVPQITGLRLPTTVNDLTIDNATTPIPTAAPFSVTIAQNQIVNGVCLLKQGVFDIGTTKLTSNGIGIINSSGGKMKANAVSFLLPPSNQVATASATVEMKGNSVFQNLSGDWFVENKIATLINYNVAGITIAAAPANPLLIATSLEYGKDISGVYISGSTITTNDNLTLISRPAPIGTLLGNVTEVSTLAEIRNTTGTANFGNSTGNFIVGKVSIERYLNAVKSWRLLAAPVKLAIYDATTPTVAASWREGDAGPISLASTGYGTAITGPSGPNAELDYYTIRGSMKWYNAAINNYVELSNTTTTKIANAEGYYVFVRGDRGAPNTSGTTNPATATILRIKGNVRTGDQGFTLPIRVGAQGFQSVGNPYPSRINFRSILKTNMVEDAFTAWNPNKPGSYNVGAFETYIWNGANYARIPGGEIRNEIESGEAFFVQNNDVVATGAMTIQEGNKTIGSSVQSRIDPLARVQSKLEVNMYTASALDTNRTYLTDGVVINFNDAFSRGIDNMDARKIGNISDNLAIKNSNYLLVAERRPTLVALDSIQLNISGMRVTSYYLDIIPTFLPYLTLEAKLWDRFLNSFTPVSLTTNTSYRFNITANVASQAANRFVILFTQASVIIAARSANSNLTAAETISMSVIPSSTKAKQLDITTNAIASSKLETTFTNEKLAIEKTGISIYPNPVVNGTVNLHIGNQKTGAYQLQITNQLGQPIKTETIQLQNKSMQYSINIGSANKGTYQAIIIDEDGNKKTIGFVVN